MKVQIATHESDFYLKALDLRRPILRLPLGLDFSEDDIAAESNEICIVATEGNQVLGTLQIKPINETTVKIRQVAVHPDSQGTGVGRAISEFAESWAMENGYSLITLNARVPAVPFYLRLDYEVVGDEFIEVSIPHLTMEKRLR
ncbi:MAG: GNAT family N-acetyltransferase [Fimbriimonadaceae bacterium]